MGRSLGLGTEMLDTHGYREGPVLGVFISTPRVGADDTQSQKVEAAEEGDHQHGHGIAGDFDHAVKSGEEHEYSE